MRSEIGGFRGDPLEVRGHPVTGPHPGVLSCPEPPEERAEVSHGASWGTAKGAPPGGSVKPILFTDRLYLTAASWCLSVFSGAAGV